MKSLSSEWMVGWGWLVVVCLCLTTACMALRFVKLDVFMKCSSHSFLAETSHDDRNKSSQRF